MRQTDNKDMLIRLLSDYYKRIKSIKKYKDFKTSADATTRFVDAYAITLYGGKSNGYLSIDVRDERKRYWRIRLSLFIFWLLLLLITAAWLDSNISGLINDFFTNLTLFDTSWYELWYVPYSIRHHHSLQTGTKILLCFIILTIILKVISVILWRKEKMYDANRVSLERYQGNVRHMKFMLKDLPWQEVDSVLRKMKDAGVKFPIGYSFKV